MMDKIDSLLDGRADRRLEDAAALPKNKINKIRKGLQFMRADEIWRIALVLKASVCWLLDDEQTNRPERIEPLSDLEVSLPWCDNAKGKANGRDKPKGRKAKDAPLR